MMNGRQPAAGRWFTLTLLLSCATILALIFSVWELIEHHYFRDLDYATLHYLYITRGITSSLLIGLWAAWFVLRERRRREQDLKRSYERYRAILNSTPEAVVVFDSEFRVAEWSQAAERLYGIPRENVLGVVLTTVPTESWAELRNLLTRVETEETVIDHETMRLNVRGEAIPVAVSLSRLPPAADQTALFLEVAQDIRPRIQLRNKLLQVEKLSLLGQMTAGIAHHLNTPLTSMLLQTQMLQERLAKADAKELEPLEERIHFCQTFVQNLLRFGHRSPMQKRPARIRELIKAVVPLLQPQLHLKRATLQVDLDGLGSEQVLADANHLEVVFSALINNAIGAIPPGGSIRIYGQVGEDHRGQIHIEDNGSGIPDELLPRLFEPFFTTKPAGQGTGLGLAIARNLVEEHGGTLGLRNNPSGGARATVQLPLLAHDGHEAALLSQEEPK
jgi:PAS domain S-box-containing protein